MIQRLCPRCRTVIHMEDETSLIFCWNCSAPQVRISPDLMEQASTSRIAEEQAATASATQRAQGASAGFVPLVMNRWTGAIQCAGLAGAVAAGLTLVSFVIPPVMLLTFLWVVSAPIVTLGVYASRFRNTRITPGFAARLGILCAAAILLAMLSLDTIHLCIARFAFHAVTELDSQLAAAFAQQTLALQAKLGNDAAPLIQKLSIPEFRAGLLLCSFALLSTVYLVYSAAAGAFAGLLRSRPNSR